MTAVVQCRRKMKTLTMLEWDQQHQMAKIIGSLRDEVRLQLNVNRKTNEAFGADLGNFTNAEPRPLKSEDGRRRKPDYS